MAASDHLNPTQMPKHYHGTSFSNAMSIMKNGFSTDAPESNGQTWGPGVYLGNTHQMAKEYGDHVVEAEIHPRAREWLANEREQEHYAEDPRVYETAPWNDSPLELEDVLKVEGFSGIRRSTGDERRGRRRDEETVVFDPADVKPTAIQGPSFS